MNDQKFLRTYDVSVNRLHLFESNSMRIDIVKLRKYQSYYDKRKEEHLVQSLSAKWLDYIKMVSLRMNYTKV